MLLYNLISKFPVGEEVEERYQNMLTKHDFDMVLLLYGLDWSE